MKRFVAKHIRKAKSKYYRQYFNRYSNDSRKQWTMINSLLNRKSKMKNNITKLKFDEKVVTNPQEIADTFNDFFL